MEDTIFALATAQGKSGIAVVRLSGPASVDVLTGLNGSAPAGGRRLCRLRDPEGAILDEALVLRFEPGASFTGEAVVELHLHGSVAVVRAVLRVIESSGRARLAEPGEFTRRALLNDRLDLTQVQGLGDLVNAETEGQRRQAMRVFSGEMTDKVREWRQWLVRAIALLEATIDFVDDDVPEDVRPEVETLLVRVRQSIEAELRGVAAAARLRSGFEVALVGAPNVGKSSLLNRLTRSDAAIVSEVAGTTRDVIEIRMDIKGLPVTFLDMAGIRDSSDVVERIGISRARDRAERADLRIFLKEGSATSPVGVRLERGDITVRTKIDLHGGIGISALTGAGIDSLLARVAVALSDRVDCAGLVSTERDRHTMEVGCDLIREVEDGLQSRGPEMTVTSLREAVAALQGIVGAVDLNSILDEVFASFCLGK